MCSTSAAMGYSANGPSAEPHGRASPASSRPLTPASHAAYASSSCWSAGRRAGVVEGLVVDRRPAEVVGDPGAEHADDDVREPPRDRGDRRRAGLGMGEVDNEVAAAERDRGSSLSPWTDAPGIGHRLPEVFGVGESLKPRAKLPAPVPVQLL